MPLRLPWRLGCPVWSRAPECDALLRPGLVGPAAAKPSADWTPRIPCPPFSLSSQNQQGKRSHLEAVRRLALWCPHSKAFLAQSHFNLVGLFPPLLDWQQSVAASDKSQDYCAVPGVAGAGSPGRGTEIGQLAAGV